MRGLLMVERIKDIIEDYILDSLYENYDKVVVDNFLKHFNEDLVSASLLEDVEHLLESVKYRVDDLIEEVKFEDKDEDEETDR
jgi:hypothetical protein